MWWLLTAAASAGIRSDLVALEAQRPTIAVACSSARQFAALVDRIAASDGSRAKLPPQLTELFAPGDGGVMTEDSPLSLAIWAPDAKLGGELAPQLAGARLSITFATALDVEALAAQLAQGLDEAVQGSGSSRTLVVRDTGAVDVTLTVEGGRATIVTPGPATAGGVPDLRVLAPFADEDGCGAVVMVPPSDQVPAGGVFAVQVPFGAGRPIRFAISGFGGLGELELATPRPEMTTDRAPMGVVALGARVRRIDPQRLAANAKQRRVFEWLRRHLPLDGMTIALFPAGDGHPADLAGELPLDPDWSAERATRRVRKVVQKLSALRPGLAVVRQDDTRFQLTGLRAVTFAGVDGGVRMATDPAMLDEMKSRTGTPWLTGDSEDRAEASHLYLQLDLGQLGLGLPSPTLASLGFAYTADGVSVGELYVPLTIDEFLTLGKRAQALRPHRAHPPR